MKKLIPALCMLLVAAALMGTSTYAWFTMNTDVGVTGMSVTAATPSSLYIGNKADMSDKKFDTTATNTTAALLPASAALPTGSTVTPAWFSGEADEEGNYAVNDDGYELVTTAPDGKAYYLANTFYVMSAEEAFSNLALTDLTVTHTNGTETKLLKALRVMVVASDKDGTAVIGSVAYTTTDADMEDASAVTGVAATDTIDFYSFSGNAAKQVLIPNMAKDTTYRIDVYVYLDGEDTNCTSTNRNALRVENTTIALTFATAET